MRLESRKSSLPRFSLVAMAKGPKGAKPVKAASVREWQRLLEQMRDMAGGLSKELERM